MLNSTDLTISKDLTIRGPGAGILYISSGYSGYHVHVISGVSVTVSGLAFKNSSFFCTNGNQSFCPGFIYNEGTLMLADSIISGNMTFGGNGGGISNIAGSLTLTNSTVAGNIALQGGGISNIAGSLTLTNSTVAGNTAGTQGGGIFEAGSPEPLASTTDLTFCTIYGNTAHDGGGFYKQENVPSSNLFSSLFLAYSIVARNYASGSGPDIFGSIISEGYNLIQVISKTTFSDIFMIDPTNGQMEQESKHSTDIVGRTFSDLRIDPVLRENDRVIKSHAFTHALLTGSPAIDKIPLAVCRAVGVTTDQRGMKRPDGNEQFCDIGAYEYVDPPT